MILLDEANDILYVCHDAAADTWRKYGSQAADIGAMGTPTTISGSGDDANINANFAAVKAQLDAIRDNMQASNLMA